MKIRTFLGLLDELFNMAKTNLGKKENCKHIFRLWHVHRQDLSDQLKRYFGVRLIFRLRMEGHRPKI